jgi:hypothetical protein
MKEQLEQLLKELASNISQEQKTSDAYKEKNPDQQSYSLGKMVAYSLCVDKIQEIINA